MNTSCVALAAVLLALQTYFKQYLSLVSMWCVIYIDRALNSLQGLKMAQKVKEQL